LDIQNRLTAFAMLGAEWVMWLLVVLSVIGLAIALERAYYLLASRDDLNALKVRLMNMLRAGDVEGAKRALKASKSFEARIVASGLESIEDGPESAEERMAGEAAVARLAMERNLAFLGTVGNNAPFVGLLGTVIGIIRAFHELDESGGRVSAGLMAEIGEALVATAIGLIVALPAVASFNFFQRMIRARLARGDSLGREVLAFLKSRRALPVSPYRNAEPPAAKEDKSKKRKPADEEEEEE
jgi:biopolymer transport protein ExbB